MEPQGCSSGCQTNTGLAFVCDRSMIQVVSGDLDVTDTKAARFIAKRSLQNQRQFDAAVSVLGHSLARRDI